MDIDISTRYNVTFFSVSWHSGNTLRLHLKCRKWEVSSRQHNHVRLHWVLFYLTTWSQGKLLFQNSCDNHHTVSDIALVKTVIRGDCFAQGEKCNTFLWTSLAHKVELHQLPFLSWQYHMTYHAYDSKELPAIRQMSSRFKSGTMGDPELVSSNKMYTTLSEFELKFWHTLKSYPGLNWISSFYQKKALWVKCIVEAVSSYKLVKNVLAPIGEKLFFRRFFFLNLSTILWTKLLQAVFMVIQAEQVFMIYGFPASSLITLRWFIPVFRATLMAFLCLRITQNC